MILDIQNLPADIILRKSRERTESSEEVFSTHRPRLIELSEAHGLNYTVHEDVISGEKATSGNALMVRIMHRAEQGLSKVWVVMDIDRLARPSWEELGAIMGCVEKHGIYILTPGCLYKPDDIAHSLFSGFRLLLARSELRKYKERASAARDMITRKQGRYASGVAPFGYIYNSLERKYETHPIQYPVVEYAWSLINHYGVRVVTNKIVEKFGEQFRKYDMYTHMFHNPFYAGYPCFRNFRSNKSCLERDDWVWPEQEGDYPHPVTLQEWREVQQIISKRFVSKAKTDVNSWASAVVHFPCGNRAHHHGANYSCDAEDHRHNISANKVHRVLETLIEHALSNDALFDSMIRDCEIAMSELKGTTIELTHRLKQSQDALAKKQSELGNLMKVIGLDFTQDAMDVFTEQVRKWEGEVQSLKEQIDAIRTKLAVPTITPGVINALKQIAVDFPSIWGKLSNDERKSVCSIVFKRVDIGKNGERYAVTNLEWQEWFTGMPDAPPLKLQSEYGAKVMRLMLRELRNGIFTSQKDFLTYPELDICEEHARDLHRTARSWLNITYS
ncbi:MAG: serine integrase family protein [Armatimonadota bacterium]